MRFAILRVLFCIFQQHCTGKTNTNLRVVFHRHSTRKTNTVADSSCEQLNGNLIRNEDCSTVKQQQQRRVCFDGAIIVGAGSSGLATAACLQEEEIPCVILEKAVCIASLWQQRTYDRLKLHFPKRFCELPRMPFPEEFPTWRPYDNNYSCKSTSINTK